MKCPNCQADMAAGERFCGECGQAAPAAPPPPGQVRKPPPLGGVRPSFPGAPALGPVAAAAGEIQPRRTPAPSPSYAAEISRERPGCLVFLVDQSGSMEEPIAGGTGEPKKKVLADAVNRLLYNTVLRCAKEDGVRPYFDVGVWCYQGAADVRPAFEGGLVSIAQAAENPRRTETRRRRVPDGAGGVYEEEFELPVWFDPVAVGKTPMNAAFRAVVEPLRAWLARHPDSFPPMVINLTDGAYTDENPEPVVRLLGDMGTSDGKVLVFNCHLSKQAGLAVAFPDDGQAAGLGGLAQLLYRLSSPLPPAMLRQAQAKGYAAGPGSRGYAFNADLVTLIDFLDVGTRAIQDRMEML